MNTPLLDRPLFSLTVGEFLDLLKEYDKPVVMDFTKKDEKYVYGIDGIAELFKCSRKTAQRIKSSGRIDKAIKQLGRKIVVDAKLALELTQKKK
jgi:hypothetical protein